MKIFYTKKDQEKIEQYERTIEKQTIEIQRLFKKVNGKEFAMLEDLTALRKENGELHRFAKKIQRENENNKKELEDLEARYRSLIGKCGGLTKENNRLKNENNK